MATAKNASAQNAGDVIGLFGALMRAAIVDHARVQWSKLSPNEASCVDDALQQQGASVGAMIQNGIIPTDQRLSNIRSGCRKSIASISPGSANAVDIDNLSSKPTFDCTNVRSLTAQVMCRDRTGAAADWDLSSAYWARYFSLSQGDRQAFDQAQQHWLEFLNRTCPRTQNPGQCVLAAYRKRAAGYRTQLGGDALAEARLTPEQHAKIQQSLIGLGLLADTADGEFGSITRSAIRSFKSQSAVPESDFLTAQEREQLMEGNSPIKPATAVSPPKEPVKPPIDTPRLREARTFLTDAQQFLGEQNSVPSLPEIAQKSADLKIALDSFDEPQAIHAMQGLADLLKSVPGFADFMRHQQQFHHDEMIRNLAEAKTQATKNTFFIDDYMKSHLGGERTSSMLKMREQLKSALKANDLDEVNKANGTVKAYVTENSLSVEYETSIKKLKDVDPLASGTIIEGPPDDIVLLYNSSPTAPHVWKNVKGDVVFQSDAATRCIAGISDISVERYIDHILKDHGVKDLIAATSPCELAKAPTVVDIIAFHRSDLLREQVAYKLALAALLTDNTFRKFDVVSDFADVQKKRQELSEQT